MKPAIHGMTTGLTVMGALALQTAFVAAQAPVPQFDLTKITDSVYSFRFAIHRAMVVVTSDGVVVTDPISAVAAKNMMDEIKKITDKPVKYVVYSHNHWDHISGAGIFKDQGAKIIQHELAAQHTRPKPDLVPADQTFKDDKYVVTVGDQTIELIYVGPSHGHGMIVMRLPKERLLNVVDIVTPQRIGFRGFPETSPQDSIKALRKVEALDFDRIVPGHGPASAPKSEVTAIREYLEDLTKAVTEATQKAGNPYAIDKITELVKVDLRPKYGQWGEFDAWMMLNVDRIILEQRLGF
jgi:glyoxylase-like metal-dependent hydrolase (beta-lactamase superfamily II)